MIIFVIFSSVIEKLKHLDSLNHIFFAIFAAWAACEYIEVYDMLISTSCFYNISAFVSCLPANRYASESRSACSM